MDHDTLLRRLSALDTLPAGPERTQAADQILEDVLTAPACSCDASGKGRGRCVCRHLRLSAGAGASRG